MLMDLLPDILKIDTWMRGRKLASRTLQFIARKRELRPGETVIVLRALSLSGNRRWINTSPEADPVG
jgi:hypothetical protein